MESIINMLPAFLLVFCRVTSFFVVAPIISARNVPTQFKIGLGFFIALVTFSLIGSTGSVVMDGQFILSILREILIGLMLGFVAYLFFSVVQIAGSFIDFQMGFGIVNVIDPMTGAQSPLIGNFKFVVATLLFFALNGHVLLIRGIMDSYQLAPLDNPVFEHLSDGQITSFLVQSFSTVFVLAFQMAAPLIVSIFLADVALGILARVAPQFNIFVVGIPIKILVGFLVLALIISHIGGQYQHLFEVLFQSMQKLLQLIGDVPAGNPQP